jgi:hypothetical protein
VTLSLGTVTSASPLRVRLDGATKTSAVTALGAAPAAGARVAVEQIGTRLFLVAGAHGHNALPRGIKALNAHPGTGDLAAATQHQIATVQFTAEPGRCYEVTWRIGVPDDQAGTSGALNTGIDCKTTWAAGSTVADTSTLTLGGVSKAPLNGNSSAYAVSLNHNGIINNPAAGLITVGAYAFSLGPTWRVLGSNNLLMVTDIGAAV